MLESIEPVYLGRVRFAMHKECHAVGCTETAMRLEGGLMCRRHWRMLPATTQRTLLRHQVEEGSTKPMPKIYLDTAKSAIAQVAHAERLIHENQRDLF